MVRSRQAAQLWTRGCRPFSGRCSRSPTFQAGRRSSSCAMIRTAQVRIDECQQRDMTFAAPLKVKLRLIVFDGERRDRANRSGRQGRTSTWDDMPFATPNGCSSSTAPKRCHISRCTAPGRVLRSRQGQDARLRRSTCSRPASSVSRLVDFEFDAGDIVYVRIDRRRKLPGDDAATRLASTTRISCRPSTSRSSSGESGGWKVPFTSEKMRG